MAVEVCLFRTVSYTGLKYVVSVSRKYIPLEWRAVTVTLVKPESWRTGSFVYGHLRKVLDGGAGGSYVMVVNKPLVEYLGLGERGGLVWLRIVEYTDNPPPPPPKPYVRRRFSVSFNGSTYFFTLSQGVYRALREYSPPGSGENLLVQVWSRGRTLSFVGKPVQVKTAAGNYTYYKVKLPTSTMPDLEEIVKAEGGVLDIRVELTTAQEEVNE
ncbi:MAG: hypothetical protein QXM08_02590 [Thermofilaceae archaeon]